MPTFARWNLLDVALIAILASVTAAGVAGYRRFQSPLPEISSVTPARVLAGAARPLTVHGRYLHPYLHVFVFASGRPPAMDANDPTKQEAKAAATSASQLDLILPRVSPGVYDLYVFNESQQAAFVPHAFMVDAPELARAEMTATLRFFVATESARLLANGDRDRSTSLDPDVPRTDGAVVTAVRIDPAAHPQLEMRIASGDPGESAVWIGSRGTLQQVDLDLRVPLVKDASGEWRYNGAALRAGQLLQIETSRFKSRGMLIAVGEPGIADAGASRP